MSNKKMKARKDVLKLLSKEMHGMIKDGYGESMGENMGKKVVVSADSDEGLEKGLSKAQDILKKKLKQDKDD